ncbi:MAG: hypothetical protein ACT4O2_06300 [Beijerinckiaceae bacterium]
MAFLQEARDGYLYPAREHEVVNRVCAKIEKELEIIVDGNPKIILFAIYQAFVAWTIYDCGLAGLYGEPSTRDSRMAKGKRRSTVFKYLRYAFEEASGLPAPHSCGKTGGTFARFARIAILGLAPPKFLPEPDKKPWAFPKAIENALTPLKKKRHGPLDGMVKMTVRRARVRHRGQG